MISSVSFDDDHFLLWEEFRLLLKWLQSAVIAALLTVHTMYIATSHVLRVFCIHGQNTLVGHR
jgi:hypothetical protein